MKGAGPGHMICFGSFEFDTARRLLRRDGQDVHLTPKAFDLLGLLIEAAPRVVPKAELHERLWRGGMVSDATLIGLIKELRRALGDRDQAAPIIRTAHRIGYAFNARLAQPHVPEVSRWLISGERRIPIVEGENIVGRDPGANVWLDFATVSRRHARITVDETGVTLEDLGSKNGTAIGNTLLAQSVPLCNGTKIRFGQVQVTYREESPGLSTATQVSMIGKLP
jgi:DNA-binding winged helix-turn-helix (wHTH) protein